MKPNKPTRADGKVVTGYYKYGWDAAMRGLTKKDCPYPIGSKEEAEWIEGAFAYILAITDKAAKEYKDKDNG